MLQQSEVVFALLGGGFFRGKWELDDNRYETISPEFVAEAWGVWVESLPPELKQQIDVGGGKTMTAPKWVEEVYDCDDIALDFGVFLDRCMAVTAVKTGTARGNSASGRFNFFLGGDASKSHCRNWFIDHAGAVHQFDAGNCSMPVLQDAEKPTIFFGEAI
jgi:hypothetical protein